MNMTTIKDLMELAFMAGKIAGLDRARNVSNSTDEPVMIFDDLLAEKFIQGFDIDTEVKAKQTIPGYIDVAKLFNL